MKDGISPLSDSLRILIVEFNCDMANLRINLGGPVGMPWFPDLIATNSRTSLHCDEQARHRHDDKGPQVPKDLRDNTASCTLNSR